MNRHPRPVSEPGTIFTAPNQVEISGSSARTPATLRGREKVKVASPPGLFCTTVRLAVTRVGWVVGRVVGTGRGTSGPMRTSTRPRPPAWT